MIMMVIVKAGSSSSGQKQIGAGADAAVCSTTPILRHCVSQPNLTELIDRDNNEKNEENGQKNEIVPHYPYSEALCIPT